MSPSPPFASKAFFSLTEIPDGTLHRRYNEWHQLDHRPENLRLPGVAWGERWVRSPDCAAAGTSPDPTLANLHYLFTRQLHRFDGLRRIRHALRQEPGCSHCRFR